MAPICVSKTLDAGAGVRSRGGLLRAWTTERAAPNRFPALVVRAGGRICALRLTEVEETMRPLPVQPISGAPDFVSGASIVRGVPIPVVDLALLLGPQASADIARFVTLKVGNRRIALAVHEVLGVRELDSSRSEPVSPLLDAARLDIVEALGTLDRELLFVLRAAKIISEGVWQILLRREGTN